MVQANQLSRLLADILRSHMYVWREDGITTARTKAATTIAFFGTRILTQCIPGLVSGGCAKSKRYAKAADRKRKGYRKPPLRRPVSSTSVWERLSGTDADGEKLEESLL